MLQIKRKERTKIRFTLRRGGISPIIAPHSPPDGHRAAKIAYAFDATGLPVWSDGEAALILRRAASCFTCLNM